MAMITARAAESAARPTEAKSAPRQPSSVKISAYQSSDRPSGGNSRLCFSFSDTLTTTMKIGRAHVCTPVTNAHLVCRLLLEQKSLYRYHLTFSTYLSYIH